MIATTLFLFGLNFSEASLPIAADDLPRRGSLGVPFSPLSPELTTQNKLAPGEGLLVLAPLPGLTGAAAGLRANDILLSLNGTAIRPGVLQGLVREAPVGKPVKFKVLRDGKTIELSANMVEKPRDPGNENYSVSYSQVDSFGKKMRTIITAPKKPGKYPAIFFIQGFSPVSYDYTLATATGDVSTIDGPILNDLANSGFVTMRVEKPGVGDSEGGPFVDLDYTTELDIYRQALKQLKAQSGVDTDNVFIFGHSMGGSFGPMIACEIPVKGLAVYGTAGRTWHEYLNDTVRYQGLLAGDSFENVDDTVRQVDQLMALVFHEDKTIAEVKKSHPQLAPVADAYMPGGLFNGKTLKFWNQLGKTNFSRYWNNCNAHVLAVKGVSDFVTYDADHQLIADVVNKKNPGWGRFVRLPNSDHLFHNFPTEAESLKNWQRGKFNNDFSKLMKDWIAEVMAGKA